MDRGTPVQISQSETLKERFSSTFVPLVYAAVTTPKPPFLRRTLNFEMEGKSRFTRKHRKGNSYSKSDVRALDRVRDKKVVVSSSNCSSISISSSSSSNSNSSKVEGGEGSSSDGNGMKNRSLVQKEGVIHYHFTNPPSEDLPASVCTSSVQIRIGRTPCPFCGLMLRAALTNITHHINTHPGLNAKGVVNERGVHVMVYEDSADEEDEVDWGGRPFSFVRRKAVQTPRCLSRGITLSLMCTAKRSGWNGSRST